VSRHHTFEGVEGEDWRILLEADFIVNAEESNYSEEQIRRFRDRVFKTASGTMILNTLFAID
ncbi:MAG: phosphohydrolase, partial [Clostridia bacterium]|nr:phosphohydrolase [Clostridia bacterium]